MFESNLLRIFNYIGSALIFFGIAFFIGVNWDSLSDFLKIFSTLGSAVAAYIVAVLLHATKKYETTSSAFFMLTGLVLPIGLAVTFKIAFHYPDYTITNVLISAIGLLIFIPSQLIFKRVILLLFSILFGTSLFLSLADLMTNSSTLILSNVAAYEIFTLGLSYLFLARYLDLSHQPHLVGPLYFFGGFFILAASYYLGGTYSDPGILLWKILTPLFIFLAFILAVQLKSKSLLYLGAIFFIIYITDISTKFAAIFGNLGWPLILICVGFLFMIVGYLIFYLRRKIAHKDF